MNADKLMNETTQARAMRAKLRTGKADTKSQMSKAAGAKAYAKYQAKRRIYSEAALSRRSVNTPSYSQNDVEDDINVASDVTMFASNTVRTAINAGYHAKLHADKYAAEAKKNKFHDKRTPEVSQDPRQLQKNLMKKEIQKQAIKERAKESANSAFSLIKRFTDRAEDIVGKLFEGIAEFMESHPMVPIMIGAVLLVVLVLSASLSSCSALAGGGQGSVVSTSFTSDDKDILAVENAYKAKEKALLEKIDRIEEDYKKMDEYNYSLAEVSHDPFELAALLTVIYQNYTEPEVRKKLQTIFDHQYTLTINEVVEKRTKTVTKTDKVWVWDDDTNGHYEEEEYEEEVEYEYHILNVTLVNHGIQAAVDALKLSADDRERYQLILSLQGNCPEIFGDNPYVNQPVSKEFESYKVPAEYLTNAKFAKMMQEAQKYLGYPYVWGGSSPETSFDCSGYVSYVINHSGNGWSYGRLTAQGLKDATEEVDDKDASPGDLIFFQGTYETAGASHVGIVVDPKAKVMIHCGNPIQYASYGTAYWQEHFYCFGRLE